MASRMAGVGRVTVSERRSIMPHLIADGSAGGSGCQILLLRRARRASPSRPTRAQGRAARAGEPTLDGAAELRPTVLHPQPLLSVGVAPRDPPAPPDPPSP